MQKIAAKPRTQKPKQQRSGNAMQLPIKDYSYLRTLDLQGWYQELTRLYTLSVDYNLGLHRADNNIIVIRKDSGTTIGHIGGPIASFVVNVSAPDAIIKAEFERWLEEVRKQVKSHVANPGPRALNSKFDKKKFGTWQSVRVVQFVDALAWRATLDPLDRKNYPNSVLGRSIGRHSSKDVNTTVRVTKRALASLPGLGAQVGHELTQGLSLARSYRGSDCEGHCALNSVLVIRRIARNDTCLSLTQTARVSCSFEPPTCEGEKMTLRVDRTLPDALASERVLSAQQAAELCGVSVATFRRLHWAGQLPPAIRLSNVGSAGAPRTCWRTSKRTPTRPEPNPTTQRPCSRSGANGMLEISRCRSRAPRLQAASKDYRRRNHMEPV